MKLFRTHKYVKKGKTKFKVLDAFMIRNLQTIFLKQAFCLVFENGVDFKQISLRPKDYMYNDCQSSFTTS